MKEKILEFIKNGVEIEHDYCIFNDERVAEKITAHVFEFIHWMEQNVTFNPKTLKYLYWEDHYTAETLYEYWLNNIKK
jgi:hypothetical protein